MFCNIHGDSTYAAANKESTFRMPLSVIFHEFNEQTITYQKSQKEFTSYLNKLYDVEAYSGRSGNGTYYRGIRRRLPQDPIIGLPFNQLNDHYIFNTAHLKDGSVISYTLTDGILKLGDRDVDLTRLGLSRFSSAASVAFTLSRTCLCRGAPNGTTVWCDTFTGEQYHGEIASTCEKVLYTSKPHLVTCCKPCRKTMYRSVNKASSVKRSVENESTELEVSISNEDNISKLLADALPSSYNKILIEDSIRNAAEKDIRMRRWEKSTINQCLSWFSRDPVMYKEWREKVMCLPSPCHLSRTRNLLSQKPGFLPDMIRWMKQEADDKRLRVEERIGGIVFDEMSIQEDLVAVHQGQTSYYSGQVDMGEHATCLFNKRKGSSDIHLGTHVLQLIYNAYGGFRFPFAYFSTKEAQAPELFIIFWEAVALLESAGFQVTYVCTDGAQCNRSFLKMHFANDPSEENYTIKSHLSQNKISFIMDPKHNIKKIRNNLLKSGNKPFHVRDVRVEGLPVRWEQWMHAYHWDVQNNSLPYHRHLTEAHFNLSNQEKMRNRLAEQVLDKDMLHLFQKYMETLPSEEADNLRGTIKLLKITSQLVDLWNDLNPIKKLDDQRLQIVNNALAFFQKCDNEIESGKDVFSIQTREDIMSMLKGFLSLIDNHFKCRKCKDSIVPGRLNSDVVENFFCQQRTLIGNDSNKTLYLYGKSINSLVLIQAPISCKSNAVGKSSIYIPSHHNISN